MNKKKSRMSLLDNLAAAGAPASPAPSMMSSNRALRSARDAVDSHHVWELDPDHVINDRPTDRLNPADVQDLKDAIETNGQTVPILVRRHPSHADRYLLVYGSRRLEAIRQSTKVEKVKALVANLDDHAAVQAQVSENMARRDLSYIEKALFSQELISAGFGNQSQVAEVLTVTKSSISMAKSVIDMVGVELIRDIGPAHGVGRPRWEALGKRIEETGIDRETLSIAASDVYSKAALGGFEGDEDVSVLAFEAVERAVKPKTPKPRAPVRTLKLDGRAGGAVKRTPTGITISLDQGGFADWLEAEADAVIAELHARWKSRVED